MRSLSFGTEQVDRDRFDLLYGGMCVSPRGVARTELTTFNRLISKFEDIGKAIEGTTEKDLVHFELGDEGGTILLEESEYKLLGEMHDPVRWAKPRAKLAEETYKWLADIPNTKLKKVDGKIEEETEESVQA